MHNEKYFVDKNMTNRKCQKKYFENPTFFNNKLVLLNIFLPIREQCTTQSHVFGIGVLVFW